jgi:cytochrome c biogenesis protein
MLKKIGSVKLAIVLLILIVIASIVGTLIPQNWTDAQYRAKYGDARHRLLRNLQLTDVYHSYWYMALLALFCVNLSVCSLQSFGPLVKFLRRSSSTAGRVRLSDLPFHNRVSLSSKTRSIGSEGIIQEIKDVLSRRLYRLKHSDADNGVYYFERGKIGRFGPLITHASIIIILIGGIFVGLMGFKGYKNIPVGQAVDIPHTDFQVRADDFRLEFYEDRRTPKEYKSVLTVIENGVPVHTQTIEVNHPMKYKGVKFYQSSYGQMNADSPIDTIEVELSKSIPDKSEHEVIGRFKIGVRDIVEVPDSQLRIKAARVVPDFIRDGSGNVGSRSNEPRNPAALLELYEGDELKDESWAFIKYPDFHGSSKSGYSLKFLSIDRGNADIKYYTGLQISHDPGLPIIWAGCLLMVVGMFLSLYLPFKRIWVKVSAQGVEVGGRSYKNRADFKKEFEQLKSLLVR